MLAFGRFGAALPGRGLAGDGVDPPPPQLRLARQPVVLALAGDVVQAALGEKRAQLSDRVAAERRIGQRGERRGGVVAASRRGFAEIARQAVRRRLSSAASREAIGRGLARELGFAVARCGERVERLARRRRAPRARPRRGGASPAARRRSSRSASAIARSASRSASSISARRLRWRRRCAAAVGVPAARRNPSQRHKPPSRLTRRWPGCNCGCSRSRRRRRRRRRRSVPGAAPAPAAPSHARRAAAQPAGQATAPSS